jgi:segregation and condensation protein A
MTPKQEPMVGLDHLHVSKVSVREQAALIVDRLRRTRSVSFRVLVADAEGTPIVVARFLAVLELFREGAVAFDQVVALGELTIRWTGSEDGDVAVADEFEGTGDPDAVVEPVEADGEGPDSAPGPVVGDDGVCERAD